jgi:hypothetical protein
MSGGLPTWHKQFQRVTMSVGNSTRHGSDMETDRKCDPTHKYWEQAIRCYPGMDPAATCRMWDMLDDWDARRERQATGLEPPDDYSMIQERLPPPPREEVRRAAEKLCELLERSLNEEWRRLGELVQATISGDGRPAHRPPSSSIAKRNERIVEQIEYWKAQGRQMKTILPDVGEGYGLSARAVKEIWDARKRKAT